MTVSEKLSKIRNVEYLLKLPKDSLVNTIIFETAGTLSTSIQNKNTKATGLIQFMPSTASSLGYTIDQIKAMSFDEQLKLVVKYFKNSGKLKQAQQSGDPLDVYLIVLYPALVGRSDTAVMGMKGSKTYLYNIGLDIDKDGDIEKGDIRKVFNKTVAYLKIKRSLTNPLSAIFILFFLLLIFLYV